MPTRKTKTSQPGTLTLAAHEGPRDITMAEPVELTIEAAAAADGGEPKLPRFKMVAHNFKPVRVAGWFHKVIVEAAGMTIASQTRPIRMNHHPDRGVGHTDMIAIRDGKLVAEGLVSRDTEAARDVVGSSKNGFPWQASIGASVDEYEFIDEKQKTLVDGREYSGPMVVARKTTLNEISFVDLGADDKTKAKVAAAKRGTTTGDDDEDDKTHGTGRDEMLSAINSRKAELKRQQGIKAIIDEALNERGANVDEIAAIAEQAVDEEWSVKDAQIAVLKLRRPSAPSPRRADLPTQQVLEAALCMSMGISDERLAKDRDYGPDVVQRAWGMRNIGLQGTMTAALEAMGVRPPHGKQAIYDAVREAFGGRTINAQVFSTVNLPGLLGNVANKALLDAFTTVNAIYPIVADQADLSNFHTHTIYRLGMNGEFEEVGSGGEIKHGSLDEENYTQRLATRGIMIALTRQMIVNDDLNAFRSLMAQMARKARIAVEKALVNAIMESVDAFYTSARGNRLTSNALSIENLGDAEAALASMVDASGDPIYAQGKYLLVPPGLRYLAEQIFVSTTLASGGTGNQPTENPFRGRFQVVTSPFLAASALDGSSATTWYLLADPMAVPAFQVAFLDGRRQPTIESAETAFDTLGMQWRCYWDFGVAQLDYRGAVKNTA